MQTYTIRLVCERGPDPLSPEGEAMEREEETLVVEADNAYAAFRKATQRMTLSPRGRLLRGFDAETGEEVRAPESSTAFRCGRFIIHDVQGPYDGYSNGETWNGWAVPYFEWEVARQVAEDFVHLESERGEDPEGARLRFNEEEDAFVLRDPYWEDEAAYYALTISVEGERVKVYPIGSREWTWEQA